MSGLTVRKFGSEEEGQGGNSLDLSHLENNPNYKEENSEQNQQESSEQSEEAQESQESQESQEESTEENQENQESTESSQTEESSDDNTEESETEESQESEESESTESSLNNDNTSEESEEIQLTDEVVNKYLSEKLGKEFDYNNIPEPVELDPELKAIKEWKDKTGRPVEDFFKFQKDYSQVSDLDVAREFLQIEYPTLTPEEVGLELEQFVSSDDDLDNEAAKKSLALKKYATKGRTALNELKVELGEPSPNNLTPELKQKIEFADQIQQQMETNKASQAQYTEGITNASTATESMKLQLNDNLNIDFKLSEADRKEIPTLINEMPHWRNEDGSWNHQAVVQDAIKIKHFEKMIKLAFEQGLNTGKDELIKDTKNTTLGERNSNNSEQGSGKKKPVYENFNVIGNQPTLKFGKK